MNLVLDNAIEYLRGSFSIFSRCMECDDTVVRCILDPDDPYKLTEDTRQLGLLVARGTTVTVVSPADG